MKAMWAVLLTVAVGAMSAGCGQRTGRPTETEAQPTEVAGVPLPEWAPDNPSPEFLRAAKVLKAIPEDVESYSPLWPPAYEFFGTLTDEQVAEFLQARRMPLTGMPEDTRSLFIDRYGAEEVDGELVYEARNVAVQFESFTARQRELFDKLVEVWREIFQDEPQQADLIVTLYKMGAKEDLSNCQVSFSAAGHSVSINFQVILPEGRIAGTTGQIAQL